MAGAFDNSCKFSISPRGLSFEHKLQVVGIFSTLSMG